MPADEDASNCYHPPAEAFDYEGATERLTHNWAGSDKWAMAATSLQNHRSVEELFNHVDTILLAIFDHLDFSFLTDFLVFVPDSWGRTQELEPPSCWRACCTVSAGRSTPWSNRQRTSRWITLPPVSVLLWKSRKRNNPRYG